MTDPVVRVLIADDEPLIGAALRALLEVESDIEVVALVTDAAAAIEAAERLNPAVTVLDIRMPGGGGVHVARELRARAPGTRLLAFSAYGDPGSIARMRGLGVSEYLVKGASNDEIVAAVRRLGRADTHTSSDQG